MIWRSRIEMVHLPSFGGWFLLNTTVKEAMMCLVIGRWIGDEEKMVEKSGTFSNNMLQRTSPRLDQ